MSQEATIAHADYFDAVATRNDVELRCIVTQSINQLVQDTRKVIGFEVCLFIVDSMRLSRVIEQYKPRIFRLLKHLLGHGYELNIRIEEIVDNDYILIRFPNLIVVMDHLAADHTERYGGLLIADESVEDESAARYDFRVVGELGKALEGHLWSLFYPVALDDAKGRVVHELVEMGEIFAGEGKAIN